tara:strand:- start:122 stop:277 length:156 start_codon:yes stop_codon:yes gene_type:complete
MPKRDKTERYKKWGSVGLRHETRVRLNKLKMDGNYNSVDALLTEILDTIEE